MTFTIIILIAGLNVKKKKAPDISQGEKKCCQMYVNVQNEVMLLHIEDLSYRCKCTVKSCDEVVDMLGAYRKADSIGLDALLEQLALREL